MPRMCAQYIVLGACVVGAVIVSLCAAWGSAIVREAIREREVVLRGTDRLRKDFLATLAALRGLHVDPGQERRPGAHR